MEDKLNSLTCPQDTCGIRKETLGCKFRDWCCSQSECWPGKAVFLPCKSFTGKENIVSEHKINKITYPLGIGEMAQCLRMHTAVAK